MPLELEVRDGKCGRGQLWEVAGWDNKKRERLRSQDGSVSE